MNHLSGNQKEKLTLPDSRQKDPMEEAIIKAKLMLELHKGPNDEVLRKNNEPGSQENKGVAFNADDSGE